MHPDIFPECDNSIAWKILNTFSLKRRKHFHSTKRTFFYEEEKKKEETITVEAWHLSFPVGIFMKNIHENVLQRLARTYLLGISGERLYLRLDSRKRQLSSDPLYTSLTLMRVGLIVERDSLHRLINHGSPITHTAGKRRLYCISFCHSRPSPRAISRPIGVYIVYEFRLFESYYTLSLSATVNCENTARWISESLERYESAIAAL